MDRFTQDELHIMEIMYRHEVLRKHRLKLLLRKWHIPSDRFIGLMDDLQHKGYIRMFKNKMSDGKYHTVYKCLG